MNYFTVPSIRKSLRVSGGATYSYAFVSAQGQKSILLFLHGFPSSSYDWRHQVAWFSSKGYGIIVPDLLGYGASDKPMSLESYGLKRMVNDLVDILEAECAEKVHAVAHDLGSHLLSRFANYFPNRLHSATFIAVPYIPPAQLLDLQRINDVSKSTLGYERFGYWNFFKKEEAGSIIANHAESFFSIFYPSDPSYWETYLAPLGALEDWLQHDRRTVMAAYITEEEYEMHSRIFQGEYGPALNWFKYRIANGDYEEECKAEINPVLKMPVLVLQGTKDKIAIPQPKEQVGTCIRFLKVLNLPTGHWIHLEAKDVVNRELEEFVRQSEHSGRVI
ncbi:putative epoxide hydrolase [Truncatella angustata]|uniref:Epoxide hydrolase n=1 Tax=Truncatella angustata TaxID=152316 RepID=A0A9P8UJF2_9PEZI|nr:putative epoxide hydrolase [Truncatella angustata]KAH6653276.1 putative epoxide hydrolase [Truncatella angustata]